MKIDIKDLKSYESRVAIVIEASAKTGANKKIEMITNPYESTIRYEVNNKHVTIAIVQELKKAVDVYNNI